MKKKKKQNSTPFSITEMKAWANGPLAGFILFCFVLFCCFFPHQIIVSRGELLFKTWEDWGSEQGRLKWKQEENLWTEQRSKIPFLLLYQSIPPTGLSLNIPFFQIFHMVGGFSLSIVINQSISKWPTTAWHFIFHFLQGFQQSRSLKKSLHNTQELTSISELFRTSPFTWFPLNLFHLPCTPTMTVIYQFN